MRKRHFYRHKHTEEDIDVTALLNVLVVLIAFLILSAVFSRITIQEINLPTQTDNVVTADKPQAVIEVILRKDLLEIGNGKNTIVTIPKVGNKYDVQKLTENLLRLKEEHKEKEDVTILIEPDIEYEYLIQVMDAVKTTLVKKPGQDKAQKILLFPQVSIGDAP